MSTVCISTKMSTPEKVGGQNTASPPLQKVGGMSPCPPTDLRPWRRHLVLIALMYELNVDILKMSLYTTHEAWH